MKCFLTEEQEDCMVTSCVFLGSNKDPRVAKRRIQGGAQCDFLPLLSSSVCFTFFADPNSSVHILVSPGMVKLMCKLYF